MGELAHLAERKKAKKDKEINDDIEQLQAELKVLMSEIDFEPSSYMWSQPWADLSEHVSFSSTIDGCMWSYDPGDNDEKG